MENPERTTERPSALVHGQQRQEGLLAEDHVFVDLVGQHDHAEVVRGPREIPHALRADAGTGRVRGIDEHEELASVRVLSELVARELEGPVAAGGNGDDVAARGPDRLVVGAVAGVLDRDAVARVHQREHGQEETLLGAVGDGDLGGRIDVHALLAGVAAGNPLAQRLQATDRPVPCGHVPARRAREMGQTALDDGRERVQVGVAPAQGDDVLPLSRQRHHLVAKRGGSLTLAQGGGTRACPRLHAGAHGRTPSAQSAARCEGAGEQIDDACFHFAIRGRMADDVATKPREKGSIPSRPSSEPITMASARAPAVSVGADAPAPGPSAEDETPPGVRGCGPGSGVGFGEEAATDGVHLREPRVVCSVPIFRDRRPLLVLDQAEGGLRVGLGAGLRDAHPHPVEQPLMTASRLAGDARPLTLAETQ